MLIIMSSSIVSATKVKVRHHGTYLCCLRWQILLLSILLHLGIKIKVTFAASHPHINLPDDYSYDYTDSKRGPTAWRGECRQGINQSPINIRTKGFGIRWGTAKIWFDSIYQKTHRGFFAANKGHTIQVQFNNDKRNPDSNLVISGTALKERYIFANLHFHWGDRDEVGSEHSLQNRRYPMELHLVHYKARYDNLSHALHESSDDHEAVQVLAVLYELGDENIGLIPIVETATNMSLPSEKLTHTDKDLNLLKLLPRELDFIRYMGSLTTPPCTQKVAWTVFVTPVAISRRQLEIFRGLRDNTGVKYYNYRPLQPLQGRGVKYYKVLGWSSGVSPFTSFTETISSTIQDFNSVFTGILQFVCGNSLCGIGRRSSLAHVNEHRGPIRRPALLSH